MTQEGTGTTAVGNQGTQVLGITPFLTFSDSAEEAVNLYVSLFRNSKVLSIVRSDGTGPVPAGKLLNATFLLDGREFMALDGGPSFSFSEGISLMVSCQTQEEIDTIWARLSEGGEEGRCGWLKDRFGVSWQVVPAALGEMVGDPALGNSRKAMEELLKMGKIDLAILRQAYGSSS